MRKEKNITYTERMLFLEFNKDRKELFGYFYEKYYKSLCVYAYRILGSFTEAEDVVQDFFVRLLENRGKYDIEGSIRSYFVRSIHNNCLKRILVQKKNSSMKGDIVSMLSEEKAESYVLMDSEMEQKIIEKINSLPDSLRRTFQLSREESMSYREIAEKENVSVKAIEYRISKSLDILRKELKEYLTLFIGIAFFLISLFK